MPQGPYLNQMLRVETALGPRALLEALLAVEQAEGRVRAQRWGPRTLDLDLIAYDDISIQKLYGDQRVEVPGLSVPHPEIPHRDFWQRQLAQLGMVDRLVDS